MSFGLPAYCVPSWACICPALGRQRARIALALADVASAIGSEDVSTELTDFLDAKGTVHQRTVPYSPETNGAAEW